MASFFDYTRPSKIGQRVRWCWGGITGTVTSLKNYDCFVEWDDGIRSVVSCMYLAVVETENNNGWKNPSDLVAKYDLRSAYKPELPAYLGVGPGWYDLLDRLLADIISMGWDRQVCQVKEKYGTLRFYIGSATDEVHDRIEKAEHESAETCERCGAPGTIAGPGWLKCLCPACRSSE